MRRLWYRVEDPGRERMTDGVGVLRRVWRWDPEHRWRGGNEGTVVHKEGGGWAGQQGAEEASI